MSRDYKSTSKSNSGKKGSSLLLGLFIGYLLGLVSAIGIWMYIHQADSPFIQNERPEVSTKIKTSKNENEKTRFEFY